MTALIVLYALGALLMALHLSEEYRNDWLDWLMSVLFVLLWPLATVLVLFGMAFGA